jgi:mRNA-degrading endonuclease toxin of MazEF toxin-antitoxin module
VTLEDPGSTSSRSFGEQLEQVGAIDVNRLGDHVGQATPDELWGIEEGLVTVLGLR